MSESLPKTLALSLLVLTLPVRWTCAEAIGAGVLSELGTQRETIIRVGGKVSNVDSNLGKSRRILNAMSRRIMTNHLIMVLVRVPTPSP